MFNKNELTSDHIMITCFSFIRSSRPHINKRCKNVDAACMSTHASARLPHEILVVYHRQFHSVGVQMVQLRWSRPSRWGRFSSHTESEFERVGFCTALTNQKIFVCKWSPPSCSRTSDCNTSNSSLFGCIESQSRPKESSCLAQILVRRWQQANGLKERHESSSKKRST